MPVKSTIQIVSRRAFVVSAAAAAFLGPLLARMNTALAEEPSSSALVRSPQFDEALKAILAGATPVEGKIVLELPDIAENGNFVPVTVTVDHPMLDADYVRTIHVLSTGNPVARVATFHLSPVNAVPRVQSRMRLAKTQDVIALAELSNGTWAISTVLVKVTIGGCAS
jgi:sulfur-oxidizing protein SoxY